MMKTLRGLFAICLLAAGAYWLLASAQAWHREGFALLTSGDKGKTAFSGVLFSALFMIYGIWDLTRLFRARRANPD